MATPFELWLFGFFGHVGMAYIPALKVWEANGNKGIGKYFHKNYVFMTIIVGVVSGFGAYAVCDAFDKSNRAIALGSGAAIQQVLKALAESVKRLIGSEGGGGGSSGGGGGGGGTPPPPPPKPPGLKVKARTGAQAKKKEHRRRSALST